MELTPKEKAKQLVNDFRRLARISGGSGTSLEASKECALICVRRNQDDLIELNSDKSIELFNYYQDVKKELETL